MGVEKASCGNGGRGGGTGGLAGKVATRGVAVDGGGAKAVESGGEMWVGCIGAEGECGHWIRSWSIKQMLL